MFNIDRTPAKRNSNPVLFIMMGSQRRKEIAISRSIKVQKIQGVLPRIASVK